MSIPLSIATSSLKRLLNGDTVSPHPLLPLAYPWAWEHYLNGCANHWMPNEVPMGRDIELWRSDTLTPEERHVITQTLGFFATAEGIVGNNLVLAIYRQVTNPECRQYLLRQAFEEAVHSHAFLYIIESLGLDERELYGTFRSVPTIAEKDAFELRLTEALLDSSFSTVTDDGMRRFVCNLVGYYVIMEGIFFYTGFAALLSLHQRNRMTGIGEQIQYILRDETIHLNFGIDLINGIKAEQPEIWTPEFQAEITALILEGIGVEQASAQALFPGGLPGMTREQCHQYIRFIGDRRLERIGLPRQFGVANPFPWMSEAIDLPKEKNFFETRVTDYQHAATLQWED